MINEEHLINLVEECGKDKEKWIKALTEGDSFLQFHVDHMDHGPFAVSIGLEIKSVEIVEGSELVEALWDPEDADITLH